MKKILAAALLALGFGITAPVQAGPTLQFDGAGPYNVTTANPLVVSLNVVDLGLDVVAAFNLDVVFDAGMLSVDSVDFDPNDVMGGALDSLSLATVTAGNINAWLVSFLSDADLALAQGTSVTLFTMTFDVLADGETNLAIGPLGMGIGRDVKSVGNQVIIPGGQVPEPSTLWLLVFAAVAAMYTRSRRGARVAR